MQRRHRRIFGFASLTLGAVTALLASSAGCSAGGEKVNPDSFSDSGGTLVDGGFSVDTGGFSADAQQDTAINSDAACGKSTVPGTRVPANLLLVFDRSGSMTEDDKWTSAVSAVNAALAGADNALPVGVLIFPEGKFDSGGLATCIGFGEPSARCKALYADGGCLDVSKVPNVDIEELSKSRSKIRDFLAKTKPDGNTPTRGALTNAWAYLKDFKNPGERYAVLVTDGVPTEYSKETRTGGLVIPESNLECKVLNTIVDETAVAAAGTPPVKTFVIGVPGSERADQFLSSVAVRGKTAKAGCSATAGNCHYKIGSAGLADELAKVLTEIAGRVASCVYELPTGTDVDPNAVNVSLEVGGSSKPLDRNESHADGWDFTDDSKKRIEIHGGDCDAIKASTSSKVSILLGCKTRVK